MNYKPLFRYDSVKVVGNQSWAAISYYYPFAPDYIHYEVVVFDISGETAEPIALLPSGGFNYSLTAFENVLVAGSDVYQISGQEVTLVSRLPFNFALDADPQRKMLLMAPNAFLQGDGYRVVDLSEPSNPKFSAPAVHSRQYTLGALGSDYFVLVRGPQNIGIYPISWANRERTVDRFPFSPYMNDLRIRDGLLYWTGYGFGAAGRSRTRQLFQIVDLKTKPSTLLGSADRIGDQVGWAIELNGKYAYVGTDTELVVYDVGNPGNPIETTVIKAPAISLARNGNFLYVGSNSGRTTQLLIYEISDPVQPRLVNTLPLPDFAFGLMAQKDWLAIAMGRAGLTLYSLANPANPGRVYSNSQWTWGVASKDNLLYAAADASGLMVYDLTRIDRPNILSFTFLGTGEELFGESNVNAMSVSLDARGIAWLTSTRDGRVHGLDVRNPSNPRHVFEFQNFAQLGAQANTAVYDGLLVIAGDDVSFDTSGLQNVGLYQIDQSLPGQVLPDRFGEVRPSTVDLTDGPALTKDRALPAGRPRPLIRIEPEAWE